VDLDVAGSIPVTRPNISNILRTQKRQAPCRKSGLRGVLGFHLGTTTTRAIGVAMWCNFLPLESRAKRCRNRRVAEFERVFCWRVRAARLARGFSAAHVARMLRVSRASYKRYETGEPLPHHLIGEFARITGVDIDQLFTGR
jgi:DNA-binding XRE family transcriptional regulator